MTVRTEANAPRRGDLSDAAKRILRRSVKFQASTPQNVLEQQRHDHDRTLAPGEPAILLTVA